MIETKNEIDSEYEDDSKVGLPYILIDQLLITLNTMYLGVYVTMFIQIILFIIFVFNLSKAIKEEEN